MSGFVVPEDTRRAQAAAAQPSLSAFVSANAGSGKTHVLAQRVIRLLLGGADPSRILCLTYTRAAAANMAGRVFRNLSRWATLPQDELAREIAELEGSIPDAGRIAFARRLFARALETPGGLKIQTIHAFCEAVLHQFPLEANIAGHFEMLDGQMEAALLAEARREMIADAADPAGGSALADAFAAVLELGGESGLEALLAAIVARRDALRRFIVEIGDGGPHFTPLFEAFGFSGAQTPAGLAAAVWPDGYFTPALAAALGDHAVRAGKTTAQDFAAGLAAAARLADPLERLDALRGLFLTRKAGGAWAAKSTRNVMAKGVGEFFPELPGEFDRFASEIDRVSDRIALLSMLSGTRAALVVADWLIARYERLKSARGFLDFNDLIVRTVALLSRRDAGAWVQYKLDRGIDHILLDEAQDTSPDQWAVVKALAAEFFAGRGARGEATRTVFAVGDEKQSIYSFQGAEPESFALGGRFFREKVTAAQGRFEHVRLARSFRSTWDVLSAVDLVFASEENRDGLTRDPEPVGHLAIRDNAPGHVEVWPSLSPVEVEEPDDWTRAVDHASAPAVRLARQIAATVAHWIDSGERIGEKGRLITSGDVMVLVRKRDRFIHALSRELKERGIPVAGADRLLLTGHIAVQDLMAIARIALQPDDDLSLAALLKSPAFGFAEDDLFALAADRPGSLLGALREAAKAHGGESGKAAEAWTAIARWRNEAGFVSPFAFFSGILARDGERLVAALGEQRGTLGAEPQQRRDERELDPPALPRREHGAQRRRAVGGECGCHFVQQPCAQREIDRATVVRVDQAEVPQLRALVEIRHAGRGQFQRRLHEAVVHAEPGDARLERQKRTEEGGCMLRIERLAHKAEHRLLVGGVEAVQLALGGPAQQQPDGHGEQALLRRGHRSEFGERARHGFLATGYPLGFRRQQLEHDDQQDEGHQHGPGCAGDEPVDPADSFTQQLVHEAHQQQVLRRCGLDADVPDAGALGDDDHHAGGEVRAGDGTLGAVELAVVDAEAARRDGMAEL